MPDGNKTQQKKCRYCFQEIPQQAKVCHHCSRHQNRFVQSLGTIVHVVSISGFIVSIFMMAIAFSHLKEARQERTAASEAVLKAKQAEEETRKLYKEFQQQAFIIVKNEWLRLEIKNELGTERTDKVADQILSNINLLLSIAIPDTNERAKWIQDFKKSIPK